MLLKRQFAMAWAGLAMAVATLAATPVGAVYSISAQTQAALSAVNPSLTGDAKAAAVEAALQSVLAAAIASGMSPTEAIAQLAQDAVADGVDGSTVATAITLAATAPGSGISAADLGTGLGQAAASLEKNSDETDAMEIAAIVANDGPDGSQTAFASAATDNGGSTQLAGAGGAQPQVASNNGNSYGPKNTHEPNSSPNGVANGVNEHCPSNNPSCNN